MGKMPHRRIKQPEQDHTGCMWGFISMFDFRRGGYNRRLLPDKRFRNRVLCGAGLSPNVIRSLKESDYRVGGDDFESTQPMLDAGKPSVKKLMEEDMGFEDKRSSSCHQQKSKQFSVSSVMELEDLANNADINNIVREIFIQIQQNSGRGLAHETEQKDDFCVLSDKKHKEIEKQLIEAAEVVLHERLISGMPQGLGDRVHCSIEYKDALEILISHKDLLFKYLEDSNSELRRRIHKLLKPEQGKSASQKESEVPHSYKHRLFSRRRVRSQEVVLFSEIEGSDAPNSNAVVGSGLKTLPASTAINSSMPSLKTKSSFSFTEIKRRLKHAMGKDKERDSTKNEAVKKMSRGNQVSRPGGEIIGRMSPSRNPHLEAEIHPKRLSSPRRSDNGSMERFDMTLEPGKHSYQMPNEEGANEKFHNRQDLELACKSSSMPDSTFSPTLKSGYTSPTAHPTSSSPRKPLITNEEADTLDQEKSVNIAEDLSAQSSFVSSCDSDDTFSSKLDSWDPSPIISEVKDFDDDRVKSQCSVEVTPEAEVTVQELSADESTEPPQSCDAVECEDAAKLLDAITITVCDEQGENEENFADPLQGENEENFADPLQIILAPNSIGGDQTEHFDDATSKMDKPSPISVLQPVYLDDEISPPSTKILRGELPVSPLQIRFDEDDLSESERPTSDEKPSDSNESKQKYIEKILKLSSFSWDTVYMRSLSTDLLLDTSIYDADIGIHSDQSSNDYKLLFDCLDEVLLDLCAQYFGRCPLTSLTKRNSRPIPGNECAFEEIWKGVEWHLLPLSPPRSLEQIIAKDLAKDGKWMDLRVDANNIGSEIEDLIFQELVEETAMSCISEYVDE